MIGLPWWMFDSWAVTPGWLNEPNWTVTDRTSSKGGGKVTKEEPNAIKDTDKDASDNFDIIFDAMDKFYRSCGMTGEMTFVQNGKTRSVKLGADHNADDNNNYKPDDTPEAKKALAKIRDDLAVLIQDRNIIAESVDEYNDDVKKFNKELSDYTKAYGKTEYTEQKNISLKQ